MLKCVQESAGHSVYMRLQATTCKSNMSKQVLYYINIHNIVIRWVGYLYLYLFNIWQRCYGAEVDNSYRHAPAAAHEQGGERLRI